MFFDMQAISLGGSLEFSVVVVAVVDYVLYLMYQVIKVYNFM